MHDMEKILLALVFGKMRTLYDFKDMNQLKIEIDAAGKAFAQAAKIPVPGVAETIAEELHALAIFDWDVIAAIGRVKGNEPADDFEALQVTVHRMRCHTMTGYEKEYSEAWLIHNGYPEEVNAGSGSSPAAL